MGEGRLLEEHTKGTYTHSSFKSSYSTIRVEIDTHPLDYKVAAYMLSRHQQWAKIKVARKDY